MGLQMNIFEERGEGVAPTILLVDDERDILPEYQEFFELSGFETLTCADPVDAFNVVMATSEIRVVITDLRMAGLDGSSLIRDLRAALPPQRRVDFMILTGDASVQPTGEIDDVPVFLKPADTDALVAAIRAAVARP
jgi:DNA-binding response OmpR family regulator